MLEDILVCCRYLLSSCGSWFGLLELTPSYMYCQCLPIPEGFRTLRMWTHQVCSRTSMWGAVTRSTILRAAHLFMAALMILPSLVPNTRVR